MSALGDLGRVAYKIGFWDSVWKWKENMREIRMEVVKVPFPVDQPTL